MIKVGDMIKFKDPSKHTKWHRREVKELAPDGVLVNFFHRPDYFVAQEHYVLESDFVPTPRPTPPPKVKKPRKPARWCYLIDLKTKARVSYADTHPTRLRDLLARLTKQYPTRDFGFRSARRRPVGDTVDRLDTETLHIL